MLHEVTKWSSLNYATSTNNKELVPLTSAWGPQIRIEIGALRHIAPSGWFCKAERRGDLPTNFLTDLCLHRLKNIFTASPESIQDKSISQYSSVGVEKGYVPDGRDSIPVEDKRFSPLHSFQTGSGAHPTSYPMGLGGKPAGAWSWPLTFI
jgi:hypothetical protein